MRLIDLFRQVQGVLPLERGGLGNQDGAAQAVVVPLTNRYGATIPLGSILKWVTGGVTLATSGSTVIGVAGGGCAATGLIVPADAADGSTVAVMVRGVCRALISTDVTGGHYAYISSTGQCSGASGRTTGAFGRFLQDGTQSSRPLTRMILWGVTDPAIVASALDPSAYGSVQTETTIGGSSSNGVATTVSRSDHKHGNPSVKGGLTVQFAGSGVVNGTQIAIPAFPYPGTIARWSLAGSGSGSAVVDIWKTASGASWPTSSDKITASAPPTLSSQQKATSATLTGWSTTITALDQIVVSITSVSGISDWLALTLDITRT